MASEITDLLKKWGSGDRQVEPELFAFLYGELRQLAMLHVRKERGNHTLQPTALVNEVYVRLLASQRPDFQNRSHFLAVASRAMRHVLVDYARSRRAAKRDGGIQQTLLENVAAAENAVALEVLAVNDALDHLAKVEPRQAQVVELRFFGGLSFEEAGEALGVSPRTAKRDWRLARLTLYGMISGAQSDCQPQA